MSAALVLTTVERAELRLTYKHLRTAQAAAERVNRALREHSASTYVPGDAGPIQVHLPGIRSARAEAVAAAPIDIDLPFDHRAAALGERDDQE